MANGISEDTEDIEQRQKFYGDNQKPVREPPGLCQLLLQALDDFMLKVLIVAAIILMVLELATADDSHRSTAWIEGFAILLAVFISAGVTAVNDYQKERQFMKLNEVSDARKTVSLKRSGTLQQIHQDKVLVGDIVQLNEGM